MRIASLKTILQVWGTLLAGLTSVLVGLVLVQLYYSRISAFQNRYVSKSIRNIGTRNVEKLIPLRTLNRSFNLDLSYKF